MRQVICPECGSRVHRGACSACFWNADQQFKKEVTRPEEMAEPELAVAAGKEHVIVECLPGTTRDDMIALFEAITTLQELTHGG